MIQIKSYPVPKKNGNTIIRTINSGGSTTINATTSEVDNWFYFNNDYNAVCCRYDMYSNGSLSSFGAENALDEAQVKKLIDLLNMITVDTTNNVITVNGSIVANNI